MDGNYIEAEHTYIFATLDNIKTPIITEHYSLPDDVKKELLTSPTPFSSAYAECVFLRTYSRKKEDSSKESWAETVIRVVEGTIEAYLTHYKRNGLSIDYKWLVDFSAEMARSFFHRQWSPPGRGLYAMGTDHTRRNGNAALNNCYACETKNLVLAASFLMDNLMCGGGVGNSCDWNGDIYPPNKDNDFIFKIPDTRQGWVAAVELLLRAYIPVDGEITNKFPIFDFSLIRPYGAAIKGFGGTASGPEPLRKLLQQVEVFLDTYLAYQETTKEWSRLPERIPYQQWEDERKEKRKKIFVKMVERLYDIGCYPGSSLDEELKKLEQAWKTGKKTYGRDRLVVDITNSIGACVVAGNVRRSAEIALGDANSQEFLELKNQEINPERAFISWMSNNTIRLEKDEDFVNCIPEISKRVIAGGEPGMMNLKTAKHARLGDKSWGEDTGRLMNPCGEIILNSFEPCCLSSLCPVRCVNKDGKIDESIILKAARYATFYASTVTLIRHHWSQSNAIIAKNRRIGVSLTGLAELVDNHSYTYLNGVCRKIYDEIRSFNTRFAEQSGIPRSIRVTTIKPEGTLSIIMETSAGMHWPICRYAKRRIALSRDSELLGPLEKAGYPLEQSILDENTIYAIFPISSNGARPEREVSIFEQFGMASSLLKHYSDNSVSFTGHFSLERESKDVERVLAMFAPMVKSCSMMPYSDDTNKKTIYKYLPFEEINEQEYQDLINSIKPVLWKIDKGSDAKMEKGCNNDYCTL